MTSSHASATTETMAVDEGDGPRPSFTSFWKKTKRVLRGNRLEFVQPGKQSQPSNSSESPEGAPDTPSSKPLTATEKAKLRRAQVRRAQIQHRQRKAEYVKKLELDVTHFRELIALTESEAADLNKENSAMRAQLQLIGITISMSPSNNQDQSPQMEGIEEQIDRLLAEEERKPLDLSALQAPNQTDSLPQGSQQEPEIFGDINLDDIIVTLKKDDEFRTPVFSVRSTSSEANTEVAPSSTAASTPPPMIECLTELSKTEEQLAVNFILAMEHICWDHFWMGDFPDHEYQSDEFKGHTLMASTFCMARAPQCVYQGRKQISGASECGTRRTLSKKSHMPAVHYEWPSARITLSSLHSLASSLNPGDIEITPVQAWFELADRYPKDILLDRQILYSLSQELNGVVKCLEFGAVMEREAFESVVGRVLGPGLESMTAQPAILAG